MGSILSSANLKIVLLGAVGYVVGIWLWERLKNVLP